MLSPEEKAAAARKAWETIRARKAAGVYDRPREEKLGPVIKPPDFVRCEVGERFRMVRTECRWENARFQGVQPQDQVMRRLEQVPPVIAAPSAPAIPVDRRELQVRTGQVFVPIFPK